jgi:hypothetical protein
VGLYSPAARADLERVPTRLRPELNPVEYLWSHWKQHELSNYRPASFGQLNLQACHALRRIRLRPTLVCAFWHQSGQFPA